MSLSVTVLSPLQGKERDVLVSDLDKETSTCMPPQALPLGIPPTAMKRLRAAAAWTSGGYRAGMCTTTLLSITKTEPASRLHVEVVTEYLVFLRDHPSLTKRIERSWQLLLRRFVEALVKRRWFQVTGFLPNVIAILLELGWKPLFATHWISDLEYTWTCDLTQTFDLVPIVTDIERASRRHLWKAAPSHRHGESFAAATLDLTVLRRHLHSLRKRGLLERDAMLHLAACGGLWTEQRRYEAFLQDHAICPRCDTEIESEGHSFYVRKGNAEGDPALVEIVAKTDWILPEAREGLTKPDRRSFFLRGLAPGSWLVEAPYDGPDVFSVADAIQDGFHFGLGTYFTDGSKLYPDPRRREVGWGFCSVTADLHFRTGAYGPVTLENATVPVSELSAVTFLVESSVGPIHIHSDCKYVCAGKNKLAQRTNDELTSHFGPDCSKLCRDIMERLRSRGAKLISLPTTSTSLRLHLRYSWAMLWRTRSPRKVRASSLLSLIGVKWIRSLGQYSSVSMPPAYLLLRLHREAPLLTQRMFCSPHDVSVNASAPVWRMLHHTLWSLLAKSITAMFANFPHLREVRWTGYETPFAQDRPILTQPCQSALGIKRFMSRIK